MFDGARWLNAVGIAGTVLAVAREIWRARSQVRHMHRTHGSEAVR
jgi:hypothetical protein